MAGQMDERDELALKLRQVLVEARTAAGLTQAELAKKLGRTQTFVSNYERGERKVGVVEFVLIGRALGVDARELLGQGLTIGEEP
jgi:transcriptional regulator with XRE-family HTH domain